MKLLFNQLTVILLLCSSSISFAQNDTIYFSSGNSSDVNQDGTIEHPYSKLKRDYMKDNSVCLFKGGEVVDQDINSTTLYFFKNIVFNSYGGGRAVFEFITIIGCKNLTIQNIDISRGEQWSGALSFKYTKDDTSTYNNDILLDNVKMYGTGSGTDNLYYGIQGGNVTNLTVKNSEFYHMQSDAIYLHNLRNALFENLNIYDINMSNGPGDGFQLGGFLYDLTIRGCNIDRTGTKGKFCIIVIPSDGCGNIVIENNELSGPDPGNGGAALFFSALAETPSIIRGNTFHNTLSGVYIHTYAEIAYNKFYDCDKGINILSGNADIINNVFHNNDVSIENIEQNNESSVKNNIIYLTGTDQKSFVGFFPDATNNIQNMAGAETINGAANITDPMFVDAGNYDFHLQAGSPAIDAGVDCNVDYDFDGNINHCNGNPDIGVYEIQNNCPEVQNYAPIIVAPSDRTLMEKEKYVLDLSQSHDQDDSKLYYYWEIPKIIDIVQYADDNSVLALYAPEIEHDTVFEILSFVTDGRLSSDTAQTTINVKTSTENDAPIADAGDDKLTLGGTLIELSGEDSYDPDGDNITYFWSESSGEIALMNVQKETVSFYAPQITEAKTYLIELIVYDGIEMSGIDAAKVAVEPNTSLITTKTATNQISIYPTIVNESIFVRNIESGSFSAEIISMDGRIVFKLDDLYASEPINVSSLNSGMYKIRITGEKEQETFSIIKK